jgi:hypothetical protein
MELGSASVIMMTYPTSGLIMLSYFSLRIWTAASFREWVSLFGGILTTSLICTMANIIQAI